MAIGTTRYNTLAPLTHCRRDGVRRTVSVWVLSVWLLTLLACSFGEGLDAGHAPADEYAVGNAPHTHAHPGTGDEPTVTDLCCDLLQLPAMGTMANPDLAPTFKLLLSTPVPIALCLSLALPVLRPYRFSHPPNRKPFLYRIANCRWPNAPPRASV